MRLYTFLLTMYLDIVTITLGIPTTEPLPPLPPLRRPVLRSWSSLDHGFVTTWDPVVSDDANPIIGFKLKVWIMGPTKTHTSTEDFGDETIVKENNNVKYDAFGSVPTYEPMFVKYALGREATSAEVVGAEPDVYYQVRVQAYSAAGDGPLSRAIGLRGHPKWSHNEPVTLGIS